MNWMIFLTAMAVNLLLCLLQSYLQEKDVKRGLIAPRHSLIPGTNQKFLHWQDFYTQVYGDIMGLPFVMNGFMMIFPALTRWELLAFALSGLLSMVAFFVPRLAKDHKPSWGEPTAGHISTGGYVHSFYFSLLSAMAIICLWVMINGGMTKPIFVSTLVGMVIWALTCILDIATGHFEPLKKTTAK